MRNGIRLNAGSPTGAGDAADGLSAIGGGRPEIFGGPPTGGSRSAGAGCAVASYPTGEREPERSAPLPARRRQKKRGGGNPASKTLSERAVSSASVRLRRCGRR